MAQLVEQLIRNEQAVGSSPTTSFKEKPSETRRFRGFLFAYAMGCLGLSAKRHHRRTDKPFKNQN